VRTAKGACPELRRPEQKGRSAVLVAALRLFEVAVAVCVLALVLLLVSLASLAGLAIKR
jgi:hypothetical protein